MDVAKVRLFDGAMVFQLFRYIFQFVVFQQRSCRYVILMLHCLMANWVFVFLPDREIEQLQSLMVAHSLSLHCRFKNPHCFNVLDTI